MGSAERVVWVMAMLAVDVVSPREGTEGRDTPLRGHISACLKYGLTTASWQSASFQDPEPRPGRQPAGWESHWGTPRSPCAFWAPVGSCRLHSSLLSGQQPVSLLWETAPNSLAVGLVVADSKPQSRDGCFTRRSMEPRGEESQLQEQKERSTLRTGLTQESQVAANGTARPSQEQHWDDLPHPCFSLHRRSFFSLDVGSSYRLTTPFQAQRQLLSSLSTFQTPEGRGCDSAS